MRCVADLINYGVTRFPDRAAVSDAMTGRTLTFREVDQRASRLVTAWRDLGITAGDRVALLMSSDIEYLELHVAAQRAGVIASPLNTRTTVGGLRDLIASIEPRLLIHGAGVAETAEGIALARTWYLGGDGYGSPYGEQIENVPQTAAGPIEADAPALILFTSGSTGTPKGVVLTNAVIYSRAEAYAWDAEISSDDVMVQFLPLFQMPLVLGHTVTMCGGRNIIYPGFDPRGFADAVRTHSATTSVLVPTMINLICGEPANASADFNSLRTIIYGGSGIPGSVLAAAQKLLRCNMNQYFGQTECAPMTTLRPADHAMGPSVLRSAGRPERHTEVRVIDDDGRPLPPGQAGEVVARSPHTMLGYWRNPEATAEVIDDQGWVHSGDIGYFGDDGFLYVTDRLKDMIVSGGFNVGSIEVENVVAQFPGVREVAVIGIPHLRWGEAVHAVIVGETGVRVDADELRRFCATKLDPFKVPKSVELVDELPKNEHQKVLKRQLREPYWKGREVRVG